VLSAPGDRLGEIDQLLARYAAAPRWFTQPASPRRFQLRLCVEIEPTELAKMAVELSRLAEAFEICQIGVGGDLYLFHSGLGLKYLAMDDAGEVILRAGQLDRLLSQSNGNMQEFQRMLRIERGQLWMDILEPLRRGLVRLDQLPRAV